MLKKVLGRALAGTAATALIAVPGAMTIAPQLAPMACTYPDPAATSTDVSVSRTVVPYGARNAAFVNVESAGATPQGAVVIRMSGEGSWTRRLEGGSARAQLPRYVQAENTYTVTANYRGTCRFRPSSDSIAIVVQKASVSVNPYVINKRRGILAVALNGVAGLDPRAGKATFVVRNAAGKVIRQQSQRVRWGAARVDVRDLNPKQRYTLSVRFAGTKNFLRASGSIRF
jgi:hypothetical protein